MRRLKTYKLHEGGEPHKHPHNPPKNDYRKLMPWMSEEDVEFISNINPNTPPVKKRQLVFGEPGFKEQQRYLNEQGGKLLSPGHQLKLRLRDSITPIGYDTKHAVKEFIAGKRLPFTWDGQQTTFDDFDKLDRWKNPETGEMGWYGKYAKDASKDAWNMYLGFDQESDTYKQSFYQPSSSKNKSAKYHSFNYDDDIWDEAVNNKVLDLKKGESKKIKDSSAGGFTLKNYKLGKGYDSELKLPYISYYDNNDYNIDLGAFGSIKGEDLVGEPFEVYGRMYYDPKTKKRVFPESEPKKKDGGPHYKIPLTYANALKTFTDPNYSTVGRTGYNALTNTITYDPNSEIENVNNDWWGEHEKFHHLQNLAGGLSTSGIVGKRPNPNVASNMAIKSYYDRRDSDIDNTVDKMIKKDPSLQFIPKDKLIKGSGQGFIGAESLQYANPDTVEGEARAYENYIREGNPSIFELTDEEAEKYRAGGYIVEELENDGLGDPPSFKKSLGEEPGTFTTKNFQDGEGYDLNLVFPTGKRRPTRFGYDDYYEGKTEITKDDSRYKAIRKELKPIIKEQFKEQKLDKRFQREDYYTGNKAYKPSQEFLDRVQYQVDQIASGNTDKMGDTDALVNIVRKDLNLDSFDYGTNSGTKKERKVAQRLEHSPEWYAAQALQEKDALGVSMPIRKDGGDGGGTYTVKDGDTFRGIANRLGIPFKDLEKANPGINYDKLSLGQVLNLPEAKSTIEEAAPVAKDTIPVAEQVKAIANKLADKLKDVEEKTSKEDIVINLEGLKKGIAHVESADGTLMINPTSSATGLYGQLYNEVKDLDELKGVTREEFAKNIELQNKIFEKRFYKGLPGVPSLQSNAMDLYEEYSPQIKDFNYSYEDIAALSNFLGRQGTRKFFASLRDSKEFKPPGINKTPSQYLEGARPSYIIKEEQDGGFIEIDLFEDELKAYVDGGYVLEELEEGGGDDIISPDGDPYEYKKVGDKYYTRLREGEYDQEYPVGEEPEWKLATGDAEEAIKTVVYKEKSKPAFKKTLTPYNYYDPNNYEFRYQNEIKLDQSQDGLKPEYYSSQQFPILNLDGTDPDAEYNQWLAKKPINKRAPSWLDENVFKPVSKLYDKFQKTDFGPPGDMVDFAIVEPAKMVANLGEDIIKDPNKVAGETMQMMVDGVMFLPRMAAEGIYTEFINPDAEWDWSNIGSAKSLERGAQYATIAPWIPAVVGTGGKTVVRNTGKIVDDVVPAAAKADDVVPTSAAAASVTTSSKAPIQNQVRGQVQKVDGNIADKTTTLTYKSFDDNGKITNLAKDKTGKINTEQALKILDNESSGTFKSTAVTEAVKKKYNGQIPKKIDPQELQTLADETIPMWNVEVRSGNRYGIGKQRPTPQYGIHRLDYDNSPLKFEPIVPNVNQGYKFADDPIAKSLREKSKEMGYLESEIRVDLKYIENAKADLQNPLKSKMIVESERELSLAELSLAENQAKLKTMQNEYYKILDDQGRNYNLENNTLVFRSDDLYKKGFANSEHTALDNTVAHVNYVVRNNSPKTFTVTQFQSDAFQSGVDATKKFQGSRVRHAKNELQTYANYKNAKKSSVVDGTTVYVAKDPVSGNDIFGTKKWFDDQIANFEKKKTFATNNKEQTILDLNQAKIDDANVVLNNLDEYKIYNQNWESRTLQETVDYAAKNGQTTFRFPTGETNVKVQGYSKRVTEALKDKSKMKDFVGDDLRDYNISQRYEKTYRRLVEKTYGVKPRRVTDVEGNSWWQFDIPEKVIKGNKAIIPYKQGGSVEANLSLADVQRYVDRGYILEEIN